jgi:hypothetical protein
MIIQFGNYKHADNETALSTHQERVANAEGVFSLKRVVYQIRGRLQSDSQANLTAALLALEQAYTQENVNLTLFQNDGVTPTAHVINAAQCLSVRARVQPSYPTSEGAEYSNYRNYEIQVEALMPANPLEPLVSFTETVQLIGGGAEYLLQEAVVGPSTPVQLQEQSPYIAIQVGSATGTFGFPALATPLYPQGILSPKRQIVIPSGPTRESFGPGGPSFSRYTISWSFFFESPQPINITPRFWV